MSRLPAELQEIARLKLEGYTNVEIAEKRMWNNSLTHTRKVMNFVLSPDWKFLHVIESFPTQ